VLGQPAYPSVYERCCRCCYRIFMLIRQLARPTWQPRGLHLTQVNVCTRMSPAAVLQVDADEAARQAHLAAMRRVGRGGLNEEAADNDEPATAAAGAGARRQDTAVSEAQVVRHPSEAERVLRLLQQQLGRHGLAR
jgi:hypothetical protein